MQPDEKELLAMLAQAAKDFNAAVETVVENTDGLTVTLNTTTRSHHKKIDVKRTRPIEAVEYTVTREIATFEARPRV